MNQQETMECVLEAAHIWTQKQLQSDPKQFIGKQFYNYDELKRTGDGKSCELKAINGEVASMEGGEWKAADLVNGKMARDISACTKVMVFSTGQELLDAIESSGIMVVTL